MRTIYLITILLMHLWVDDFIALRGECHSTASFYELWGSHEKLLLKNRKKESEGWMTEKGAAVSYRWIKSYNIGKRSLIDSVVKWTSFGNKNSSVSLYSTFNHVITLFASQHSPRFRSKSLYKLKCLSREKKIAFNHRFPFDENE